MRRIGSSGAASGSGSTTAASGNAQRASNGSPPPPPPHPATTITDQSHAKDERIVSPNRTRRCYPRIDAMVAPLFKHGSTADDPGCDAPVGQRMTRKNHRGDTCLHSNDYPTCPRGRRLALSGLERTEDRVKIGR